MAGLRHSEALDLRDSTVRAFTISPSFRRPGPDHWYRAGEDVERELPILSTFLVHVNVRDTSWYLSAAPELMTHAARRLDERWEVRL